jgi:hypothetical protein
MNPLVRFKRTSLQFFVTLIPACFALLPLAQASAPPKPEDRGNGNSAAENVSALNLSTTGGGNTAHGWYSLFSDTTGSFNTADGYQALYSDTSGRHNTANGFQALYNNTGGGGGPGMLSPSGSFNTATGSQALFSNTVGYKNSAHGFQALYSNDSGRFNTATGIGALYSNTTGDANTATGIGALGSNTDGHDNVANGSYALFLNTSGHDNVANGNYALYSNTADGNTATGSAALQSNTIGRRNTATGVAALSSNMIGNFNTANGDSALFNNTSGLGNTAIGAGALFYTTGDYNIALGFNAGLDVTTANNVIVIGVELGGANVSNSCFIGQIYTNIQPIVGADPDSVTITSTGRLGRGGVSSRRYKHDIKPMDKASEALFKLKPVSFRYNKQYDATQTIAFGLIAEEVAEVYPDLVGRNAEGQPESVRYEQINAMLLNEFLKEHRAFLKEQRKVEAQEVTITQLKHNFQSTLAEQQKQIKALTSGLEKVNNQLGLNKPAPQTVANNH